MHTLESNSMLAGYLSAALFADTPDDSPMRDKWDRPGAEGDYFHPDAFDAESMLKMQQDCEQFLHDAHDTLIELGEHATIPRFTIGSHLWFTRNGHGVCFQDLIGDGYSGPESLYETLDAIASGYDGRWLTVTDDGHASIN